MIFLIDYDRPTGRTLLFKRFDDSERQKAHDERLQIELDLHSRGLLLTRREVVILDARDAQSLRRTHKLYFEHLPDDASSSVSTP